MELYRIVNELLGEHCRPQLCLLSFSGGRCKDVKATFFQSVSWGQHTSVTSQRRESGQHLTTRPAIKKLLPLRPWRKGHGYLSPSYLLLQPPSNQARITFIGPPHKYTCSSFNSVVPVCCAFFNWCDNKTKSGKYEFM